MSTETNEFQSYSRVGHGLQIISQELVSDAVDSGRGLIWFDLHHYPLKELKGILHGSWILKVNAVDDPQKHGKAGWHILEVVKHNSLLNHNCHIEDLTWKGILVVTFIAYQQAKLHPLHGCSQSLTMGLEKQKKKKNSVNVWVKKYMLCKAI